MTGKNAVIWKFELSAPDLTIKMPGTARVIAVGQQEGVLVFWAALDPAELRVRRRFRAVNTGTEYSASRCDYLGTVQMPNGIVWHLLEDTEI